ncbi:hypothetical protein IW140_000982 [Coemansia sp. RSA 1813]|nr:hypothetical protein LPJ74_000602 [Coemansia sp. RSA 1843]KAJ2091567.1 hypothetical protein IW138_001795 [Coemansia sp. RSA 986]KAJ2212049.1 hypothetical protein EV179_004975 [Coemansia sp. RSA 487]KAJ2572233.1 hypothetical protein IW140_000982 [Coemansia sp. RSA 1813]
MEYVDQHLCAIMKEMSLGLGSPADAGSEPPSTAITQSQRDGCLADLYAILGREHIQSALAIVDSGIACLVSSGRVLFRAGSKLDDAACYCVLPGRLCTACTEPATGGATFCVHTTAVLLAITQSRYSIEALPPKVLADILFSVCLQRQRATTVGD